jgi:hypothetical protein
MGELFVYLYPLVTIISVLGYIPQIKSLIKTQSNCADIALSSWYLWTVSSLISIGYGLFHIKDVMFIITCTISFILIASVTALILYRRAEFTRLYKTSAPNA